MSRRRLAVLVGLAVPLAAAGNALGAVVTPPAGTPNLALMAIQPSDLTPGAVIGTDVGYDTPPSGFTAQYVGYFTTASTTDGVAYGLLDDEVSLAPTAAEASAYTASEETLYTSKKGRKLIIKYAIKAAGKKAHLKASDFKFSGAESAGVGSGSLVETLTLTIKHKKVREVIVAFDDGSVAGDLVATGEVGEQVPQSDGMALATAMYGHINAVLAAGATGPSGTTGTSGTSGASGAT